jgi:hypothetical protein
MSVRLCECLVSRPRPEITIITMIVIIIIWPWLTSYYPIARPYIRHVQHERTWFESRSKPPCDTPWCIVGRVFSARRTTIKKENVVIIKKRISGSELWLWTMNYELWTMTRWTIYGFYYNYNKNIATWDNRLTQRKLIYRKLYQRE